MELERKVTIATVASRTRIVKALMAWIKAHGEEMPMPLCVIYGNAARYQAGVNPTNQSEFIRFLGLFRVIDCVPDGEKEAATGEVHEAGQCILPDFLNGPIMSALQTEGAKAVQFAYEIAAVYDKSSATMYTFKAKPKLEASAESDPLAALEAAIQVRGAALQLQAPASTSAPVPGKGKGK